MSPRTLDTLCRFVGLVSVLPFLGILIAAYCDYSAPIRVVIRYEQPHVVTTTVVRVHGDDNARILREAFEAVDEHVASLKAEIKRLRDECTLLRMPSQTIVITHGGGSITLGTPQALRTPLDECKETLSATADQRDLWQRTALELGASLDECKIAMSANVTAITKERDAWKNTPMERAADEFDLAHQRYSECCALESPRPLSECTGCSTEKAALHEAHSRLANLTACATKRTPLQDVEERQRALDRCRYSGEKVCFPERTGPRCLGCEAEARELDAAKKRQESASGAIFASVKFTETNLNTAVDASCAAQLANMTAERDKWQQRAAVQTGEEEVRRLEKLYGICSSRPGWLCTRVIETDAKGHVTRSDCIECMDDLAKLNDAKQRLAAANSCPTDLAECRATQLAHDREYNALAEVCGYGTAVLSVLETLYRLPMMRNP